MGANRRLIIITGAGGLIGRAATLGFLGQGDAVLAVGRSAESLESLEAEVKRIDIDATALQTCQIDLLDATAAEIVVASANRYEAHHVVLVNNARDRGTLASDGRSMSHREAFRVEHELGVVVPFELSVALSQSLTTMLRAVVNIGSQYGLVAQNPLLYENYANESSPHYGTTKAALFQLTRELSVRLACFGTRVNAVALGGLRGRVDSAFERRYAEMLPLGRMLEPSDVVGPLVFLASEDARAVTGHTLAVTGGWEVT